MSSLHKSWASSELSQQKTKRISQIPESIEEEYTKDTLNDLYYAHYPEDYKVFRTLHLGYSIFTFGDEQYMYTRYDIMREEIGLYDSCIVYFEEK